MNYEYLLMMMYEFVKKHHPDWPDDDAREVAVHAANYVLLKHPTEFSSYVGD